MSDMNGNPYFEDGKRYATEATEINAWPRGEREVLATNGQALATLALAYEQRTANLIALMAIGVTDMTGWPAEFAEVNIKRNVTIKTRLGLHEGANK